MTAACFEPDGDRLVPTAYARGPWDPGALHGGPVAAVLTRAVEHLAPGEVPMALARVTVELLRPVPLEPLRVAAEVVRPGRRVQLAEARMTVAATGAEVARAQALRIRTDAVPLPYDDPALEEHLTLEPPPAPGPDDLSREHAAFATGEVAFHRDGAEHRFVAGTWAEAGPVTVWVRLLVPLVAGEEPSGAQRVVAAADFGNGVARVLPFETHTFINPDLTVHLLRPPVGEWTGMATRSHLGPAGFGLAESALYDTAGRLGRSVQSLLVELR